MDKVYLVTRGEHSDYSIIAAFSTRALAEGILDRCSGKHNRAGVEEFDLDPLEAQDRRPLFRVLMTLNGGDYAEAKEVDLYWQLICPACGDGPIKLGPYWPGGAGTAWQSHVRCDTKEQAVKVANERRTQYLVTGLTPGGCAP
jgi:hypothetical protein